MNTYFKLSDINSPTISDLFKNQDLVSAKELIDTIIEQQSEIEELKEKIEDLKEYKNAYIDDIEKHPYSYYGVSENDFH